MRQVTTYYADDGKAFTKRRECEEYEAAIKANKFKDTAFLFNTCGDPLPLTDKGFQEAVFIYCKDDDAAEYMFETFGSGYITPWGNYPKVVCASAGCWMYQDGRDEWVSANEILKDAEIIQKIMKK